MESLKVEQLENGCWMYTAIAEQGTAFFQIGIEADELTSWRHGREALDVQRQRRADDFAGAKRPQDAPTSKETGS